MATPPDFSTNQVLTSTAMNLVGGWVVKRDTIAAGSSSHICTGAFSADYTNYQILITGMTAAAGTPAIAFQLRTGTTTAATLYYWGGTNSNYVNRTDEQASNTTSWRVGYTNQSGSHIAIQVFRPFETASTTYYANHASSGVSLQVGGYHTTAASYDQFVLTPASSTLSGGTIIVLGYRD